jgi:hypothetical protein
MEMVDVALRRFGVIALVLTLPGLALPVFALVQNGIGELTTFAMVVIAMGLIAAFGLYVALGYFTLRAFRRRTKVN